MNRWTMPLVALVFTIVCGCSGPGGDGPPNSEPTAEPADVAMAEDQTQPWGLPMKGRFTYFADAAVFEPCGGENRLLVAMEADYLTAERAYLESRNEPRVPLLVTLVGHIAERPPMEGDGLIRMLVIDRFVSVHPGEDCGPVPGTDS